MTTVNGIELTKDEKEILIAILEFGMMILEDNEKDFEKASKLLEKLKLEL